MSLVLTMYSILLSRQKNPCMKAQLYKDCMLQTATSKRAEIIQRSKTTIKKWNLTNMSDQSNQSNQINQILFV